MATQLEREEGVPRLMWAFWPIWGLAIFAVFIVGIFSLAAGFVLAVLCAVALFARLVLYMIQASDRTKRRRLRMQGRTGAGNGGRHDS